MLVPTSLIKIRNNNAPLGIISIDPWCTPHLTFCHKDKIFPLFWKYCSLLSVMEVWFYSGQSFIGKVVEFNFFSRSQALDKSQNTAIVFCDPSNPCTIWSIRSHIAVHICTSCQSESVLFTEKNILFKKNYYLIISNPFKYGRKRNKNWNRAITSWKLLKH